MLPDLVPAEWLVPRTGEVRILDATWYLPSENRSARADYLAAHLPGAVFFDIDAVADRASPLPHMLPAPADFARAVAALGIHDGAPVVVYDRTAMACAARVWWTLRAFGHTNVAVLDGGFGAWRAARGAVESGDVVPEPGSFTARPDPSLVSNLDDVRAIADGGRGQIVDARSRERFAGTAPEPRPGLRAGHIPRSRNLPFSNLLDPGAGTLRAPDALSAAFAAAGIDTAQPAVCTCGSGVTAALLAFALHRIGASGAAVYDGSWAEWGGRDDTAVEAGP